ncbi:MAG: sulfatase-like hydrolase/transferase [Bacteroidales bacterium]|nr:sulfatase-like hydrolase/transferase [Bacteroidales bacterium]
MKEYFKLFVIIISLLLYAGLIHGKNRSDDRSPNILIILTDNQSYYELGCNGHSVVRTPNIDQFANEAVVFDHFYASPFCSPSRAEMLTGKYALRMGVHNTIGGVSIIPSSEPLLPSYLKKVGYTSGVFGKWHLGNEYPYNPLYRGFVQSFIHDGGGIGQLPDYYGNNHIDAYYNSNGEIVPSNGFSTDVLFRKAKEFIEENKDDPFFCFVSTPATHAPWQAHPEKLEELEQRGVKGDNNEMALYSMIENIDDNVGEILKYLKNSGLRENTFVIIATDQGMRYRGLSNPPPEKEFGLPDHVFDRRHHVFCMMQYPALTKSSLTVKNLAGIIDISPTILDICGISVPSAMDGKSLKPLLEGNTERWDADRSLIIQCPRQRKREEDRNVSVKTKKWRLINGNLLFDAEKDPSQLTDVSSLYPGVVDSLNSIYTDFWNRLPPEEKVLPRHIIGAEEMPEIRLNAMDWYKGDSPWTQGQIEKRVHQGTWAVDVVKPGRYQFELRRYPREASKPIEANHAAIKVGDVKAKISLERFENKAVLDMQLEKGSYDLKTFFMNESTSGNTEAWGSYFVYVKYIDK